MRIDEFSSAGAIDGSVSSTEQTRFLLFGFDIGISIIVIADITPERIYTVVYENRQAMVASEIRKLTINNETRILTV